MHSFHHSRGRIFFEIFCALTIGASCAMAWLQTGASAMLVIAGVAAAYSLVLATDAGRRSPRPAAVGLDPAPMTEDQGDLLAYVQSPEIEPAVAESPKASKAKRPSRKKKPELEAAADTAPAEPEETPAIGDEPPDEVATFAEQPETMEAEEEHHAIVTPLFEPQPLVRQQRTVFGRKAG